jgi:hypothetical protein
VIKAARLCPPFVPFGDLARSRESRYRLAGKVIGSAILFRGEDALSDPPGVLFVALYLPTGRMKPPFRFKDRAEEPESDAVLIRRVATGILDGGEMRLGPRVPGDSTSSAACLSFGDDMVTSFGDFL